MNDNQAIKIIKEVSCREGCKPSICNDSCLHGKRECAFERAVKALEEIQEYRKIGTPEECRKSLEICKAMVERNITPDDMENYMKFEDECIKQGFTLDSILKSREKQTAKKKTAMYAAYREAKAANEKEKKGSYGFFEEYQLEDAEYAVVIIGSAAGTTKDAIDALREQGKKVGLLKLRVFRPFPDEEIAKALSHCKAVAILDRCESFRGQGGPLGAEVKSAIYDYAKDVAAFNLVYGLGGRDFTVEEAEEIFNDLEAYDKGEKAFAEYRYVGLRGEGYTVMREKK